MVARDDQRGVGRGAQQKVAHGAGDGALVKVVAGEEAARADLGLSRHQVLAGVDGRWAECITSEVGLLSLDSA